MSETVVRSGGRAVGRTQAILDDLTTQLTAERTRAERAEADNAALVGLLKKLAPALEQFCQFGGGSWLDALTIINSPHPGDPLREELKRLRTEAAMRDPNGLWQGKCGHIWYKRKHGEECPVCRELKGYRDALERVCKATCEWGPAEGKDSPCNACHVKQALNAGKEQVESGSHYPTDEESIQAYERRSNAGKEDGR
jgi:hypothetical protein